VARQAGDVTWRNLADAVVDTVRDGTIGEEHHRDRGSDDA